MNWLKRQFKEMHELLNAIPSTVVMFMVVSVIVTNLMASKFIVDAPWMQVTGGLLMSWLPFLCMDIVSKHYGAKASIRLNLFALFMYLCCIAIFEIVVLIQYPALEAGGKDYTSFNSVYGTQWQILVASAIAYVVSGVVNSITNCSIGAMFKKNPDGKLAYVSRSYISTFIGQFIDNFVFVALLNIFFGLTFGSGAFGWLANNGFWPVVGAALLGGFYELIAEVIFSPIGYRVVTKWKKDGVGKEYIEAHSK